MSKFSVAAKRFGGFMKRNAFYFLIILCIASVATVIALAVTRNNATPDSGLNSGDNPVIKPDDQKPDDQKPDDQKPDDQNPDDQNPDDKKDPVKKLTFISPCNGTIAHEYTLALVSNPSMGGQWETHAAIDFVSTDLNVFAAADGTIKEVSYNRLDGNYIVIEHADGYVTKYMSLEALPALKVGDKVTQGQLIGKMAATQGTEILKGAHLHFEMLKDNKAIDPLEVIVLDEK